MSTVTEQPTKFVTGVARLSFAWVWEPKLQKGSKEAKYSAAVLIPKTDTETIKKFEAALEAAKQLGKKKGKWTNIPSGLVIPWGDGDTTKKDGTPRGAEFKGHWFINAKSKTQPEKVYRDKEGKLRPILNVDEIYSGVHAKVSINLFPYNEAGNVGIGAGLGNIFKVKDGERLSGGASAEEDFADETDVLQSSDVDDLM